MSNSGVVGDKPTVEVCKAQEGTYFLDFSGDGSGSDAVKFY